MVAVEIFGLRKCGQLENEDERHVISRDLPLDTEISQIFRNCFSGYTQPDTVVRPADGNRPKISFSKHSEVSEEHPGQNIEVVTQIPSNFAAGVINIDDTLLHFINLEDGNDKALTAGLGVPTFSSGSEELIVDGTLHIKFHRTIRMPDDNRLHQLPKSLGSFPLYNVGAFPSRFPEYISHTGGVFFPMWQREAMWIQFESVDKMRTFAVRVNIGKVNAISGLTLLEKSTTQDYIVVPGQPWIDEIAIEPGVVRQFVAMPLGSGYTVEGQVTGIEAFGGFQIEVTPAYPKQGTRVFWYNDRNGKAIRIAEQHTPRDCGLVTAQVIIMAPNPLTLLHPAKLRDFLGHEVLGELDSLELKVEYFTSCSAADLTEEPIIVATHLPLLGGTIQSPLPRETGSSTISTETADSKLVSGVSVMELQPESPEEHKRRANRQEAVAEKRHHRHHHKHNHEQAEENEAGEVRHHRRHHKHNSEQAEERMSCKAKKLHEQEDSRPNGRKSKKMEYVSGEKGENHDQVELKASGSKSKNTGQTNEERKDKHDNKESKETGKKNKKAEHVPGEKGGKHEHDEHRTNEKEVKKAEQGLGQKGGKKGRKYHEEPPMPFVMPEPVHIPDDMLDIIGVAVDTAPQNDVPTTALQNDTSPAQQMDVPDVDPPAPEKEDKEKKSGQRHSKHNEAGEEVEEGKRRRRHHDDEAAKKLRELEEEARALKQRQEEVQKQREEEWRLREEEERKKWEEEEEGIRQEEGAANAAKAPKEATADTLKILANGNRQVRKSRKLSGARSRPLYLPLEELAEPRQRRRHRENDGEVFEPRRHHHRSTTRKNSDRGTEETDDGEEAGERHCHHIKEKDKGGKEKSHSKSRPHDDRETRKSRISSSRKDGPVPIPSSSQQSVTEPQPDLEGGIQKDAPQMLAFPLDVPSAQEFEMSANLHKQQRAERRARKEDSGHSLALEGKRDMDRWSKKGKKDKGRAFATPEEEETYRLKKEKRRPARRQEPGVEVVERTIEGNMDGNTEALVDVSVEEVRKHKEKREKHDKGEKKEKRDKSEKKERQDKCEKREKRDKGEKRENRDEKGEKKVKKEKREKREKKEKREKREKREKKEKGEKREKNEKSERGEKKEKQRKGDQGQMKPRTKSPQRASSPPHEFTTMGIAAGGKLIQDILADSSPSYIWNTSRTSLINVHVVSPTSFESVTHIVPHEVPITAKDYTDAGLPFFVVEEDTENRISSSETLNAVKSVSQMDKQIGVDTTEGSSLDTKRQRKCGVCKTRLCDCIVRPCNHQFCFSCVGLVEERPGQQWRCPAQDCGAGIIRISGFSAPMNLPGEEAFKVDVPVVLLKVEDGRTRFENVLKMRI